MPIVDLPISELRSYHPPLSRAPNFNGFWKESVALAEEQPLGARTSQIESFSSKIKVTRVAFDGFLDKSPIVGWFITGGADGAEKKPALVQYHGYSANKGRVTDYLGWVMLGFSVFAVDVRGQSGESADNASYEPGYVKGYMTRGIKSESTYYYRLAYMDCYRAINYVLSRDDVDASRLGVMGASQGGGLSLAMGALHEKVTLVMAGVPFLCNFERGVNVATAGPYLEVLDFVRYNPEQEETVMRTLSYFDAMNLAARVSSPTLTSVGLIDPICPPSTVFATHNQIGSVEKELAVYPGLGHEETNLHTERRMEWAVKRLLS